MTARKNRKKTTYGGQIYIKKKLLSSAEAVGVFEIVMDGTKDVNILLFTQHFFII